MNIGEVAERSGIPPKTIRYYEDIGLVRPQRGSNGYRAFREADLHKLAFLGRARALGFSIEDIRELFELSKNPDASCEKASAIAKRHLDKIKKDKASLSALEKELSVIINACPNEKNAT